MQVKYILPLLIIVGLMFSLFIWFILSEQKKFLDEELEAKAFALSSHIASSIRLDLLLEDTTALDNRIDELQSIEIDFESVSFYNSKNEIIASSRNGVLIPDDLSFTSSIRFGRSDKSISIFTPMFDNIDSRIGHFTLTLSKHRGQKLIWNSFFKLLFITLLLLLAITVLMIFVARRINFLTLSFIRDREISSAELKKKTIRLDAALQKEKQLGEMKTHFVSVASHQFRTPLAIIQSNSELLNMISANSDPETKEKMERSTLRIVREIERMTELMDDVLILGKVASGKMTILKTKVNLIELCYDIAQQFNDIRSDNRELEVTIVGQEKLALVDSKMIRHAITNLINNAFKYSQEKNPKLALIFHNNTAVISVQDDGVGIPKSDQEHLFQPFYRAKNVVEFSGTGLGLAITKNYVELNDGTINFESEENKGSRFAITFNLSE